MKHRCGNVTAPFPLTTTQAYGTGAPYATT